MSETALTGAELIAVERARQIDNEGFTAGHDDLWTDDQLVAAAVCYATEEVPPDHQTPPLGWPWGPEWWKPNTRIRNLVKAGALIAAEIDRIKNSQEKD